MVYNLCTKYSDFGENEKFQGKKFPKAQKPVELVSTSTEYANIKVTPDLSGVSGILAKHLKLLKLAAV